VEQQFVVACNRRFRLVIGAVAAALVLMLALAGTAGWQWLEAQREKNEAIDRELRTLATSRLESDPRLAIQIALAANRIADNATPGPACTTSWSATGYLGSLEHGGAQRAVAFSSDGGWSPSAATTATSSWRTRHGRGRRESSGKRLRNTRGRSTRSPSPPTGGRWSPAATTGRSFLGPHGPQPDIRHNLGDGAAAVNAAAFTPDGHVLATGSEDGKVILWDTSNPDGTVRSTPLEGHTEAVKAVAFASDGRTLATAGDDGKVIIWDVLGPGRRTPAGHSASTS
jgi:WD40 repeat protein